MARMTDAELDDSYSALCKALGAVGKERSELFLAMLSLALIARADDAADVHALIAQVRARLTQEPRDGG
jgi:hypothetical protein